MPRKPVATVCRMDVALLTAFPGGVFRAGRHCDHGVCQVVSARTVSEDLRCGPGLVRLCVALAFDASGV